MLSQLISLFVLVPIIAFIGTILVPRKWERTIFSITVAVITIELVGFLALSGRWLMDGASPVLVTIGTLFSSQQYTFALDFYFDRLSAVFLGMAIIMTLLISIFSKYYMHREQGFKRFYATVSLFFTGLTLIILAGNFEVLFLGWEFIGMSSILLIAFYRDRVLPAKNALKVFSVYRIGDAFLLVAIWYAHHLFAGNTNFSDMSELVARHGSDLAILGSLLLVVALIKSAQFPFSYWLPRAMEGPTTSSAIFYGALSVHMGLFLLMRTFPLWEGSLWLRVVIIVCGLVTAVVASSIVRTQSSIKAQIAYASITQIGIMFIEVALGLQWLALLHFISNASLRTYQLLISPSVVSYLVHDQFFYFVTPVQKIKHTLLGRIHATFYVLGIKEWNMNTAASRFVWKPLKSAGRVFAFIDGVYAQIVALALLISVVMLLVGQSSLLASVVAVLAGAIFYLRAHATKNSARTGWSLLMLGHIFTILFLMIASDSSWRYIAMYGAGVVTAFIAGYICLRYLSLRGETSALAEYQGSIFVFPRLGNFFFIVSLVFMAFPISLSFLAQDIMLSAIPETQVLLVVVFGISYVLAGVSTMRLYMKVFFGPHKTSHHEAAYKSS
jgi:NADH-quinone oxidoreductase subunit L